MSQQTSATTCKAHDFYYSIKIRQMPGISVDVNGVSISYILLKGNIRFENLIINLASQRKRKGRLQCHVSSLTLESGNERHRQRNGELKKAMFLSHGRKSKVNISHARTVVSPRFSN